MLIQVLFISLHLQNNKLNRLQIYKKKNIYNTIKEYKKYY